MFNADLLQIVYDEPGDIEKGDKNTISNIIIDEGLMCETNAVRENFKEALLFLCSAIKS